MDDAVVVRIFERVEQLAHDTHDFGHREALVVLEVILEFASVHKLHRDEGGAVVVAEIVDGNDIRMIEASRGFGFALKTRYHVARLGALELVAAYGFQRDRALDRRVEGLVHDAHRAAPELAQDFVFAEFERGFAHGVMSTEVRETRYLYLLSISQTVFWIRRCTMVSSDTPPCCADETPSTEVEVVPTSIFSSV